jgi:sodium/potassium/calcium exchanger 6
MSLHHVVRLSCVQADNFFVPPLNLLSQKLQLSPSIAGITLLAVGNGAPDVFTAYASLSQGHIELVLG